MNERWTTVKLFTQKSNFWAPGGDQTRNFLITLWDDSTIALPRLRWRAKVQVRHVFNLSGRIYILLTYRGCRSGYTYVQLAPQFVIWVLGLGGSMVGASHLSSGGCRFDTRLALRIRFSENRAWRSFIYHSFKISPHSHISNIYVAITETFGRRVLQNLCNLSKIRKSNGCT